MKMSKIPQINRYTLRSKTSTVSTKTSPSSVAEVNEINDNSQLIGHLNSMKRRSDQIVSFYFPFGTTQNQRDFVWRVLHFYLALSSRRAFNRPPVEVFTQLDLSILGPTINRNEDKSFALTFSKVDALSNAINMISTYRDLIWPEQKDSIKLYIRIGSGNYFPLY